MLVLHLLKALLETNLVSNISTKVLYLILNKQFLVKIRCSFNPHFSSEKNKKMINDFSRKDELTGHWVRTNKEPETWAPAPPPVQHHNFKQEPIPHWPTIPVQSQIYY